MQRVEAKDRPAVTTAPASTLTCPTMRGPESLLVRKEATRGMASSAAANPGSESCPVKLRDA